MSEPTVPEQLFLHRWKSIDFTGWNEAEVREGFVIDLLHTLGYRKGTTYDLELEKPLKLSQPFHRIGRKEVHIDYAPSVQKRYFWIVEAKPGKSREMDGGDLLQVHLYAVHPEIQARLVVLTNGWQIRIYDALTLSTFDDALLVVSQGDVDSAFVELREMLGSPKMRQFQRKRMLDIIKSTLDSEVDMDVFNDLSWQLQVLIREGRNTVEENGKQLWMVGMAERFAKEGEELRNCSSELLIARMDRPHDGRPGPAVEFARRVEVADCAERTRLIDLLAMRYSGRPHNIFRVQALHALVVLVQAGVEVSNCKYTKTLQDSINRLALGNIVSWERVHITPALRHLDNATSRVSMKLCVRAGTQHFEELLRTWMSFMTAEERAKLSPSLEGIVSSTAAHLREIMWHWYSSRQSPEDIWKGIWDLQAIEDELDKIPPRTTSEGLDFYGAQHVGLSWDPLLIGTWNVLRDRPGLTKTDGIDPRVLEFAMKTREEVLSGMPPELRAPVGYSPEKTMVDAVSALDMAYRTRVMTTVGQNISEGLGSPNEAAQQTKPGQTGLL